MHALPNGRVVTWIVGAGLACALPALANTPSAPDTAIAFPAAADRRWQLGLVRPDRLQHGSLSALLAAGLRLSGRSRAEAFTVTLALGALKEVRDARSTKFDIVDLAADAAGAAIGSRTSPSAH